MILHYLPHAPRAGSGCRPAATVRQRLFRSVSGKTKFRGRWKRAQATSTALHCSAKLPNYIAIIRECRKPTKFVYNCFANENFCNSWWCNIPVTLYECKANSQLLRIASARNESFISFSARHRASPGSPLCAAHERAVYCVQQTLFFRNSRQTCVSVARQTCYPTSDKHNYKQNKCRARERYFYPKLFCYSQIQFVFPGTFRRAPTNAPRWTKCGRRQVDTQGNTDSGLCPFRSNWHT